MKPLLFDFPMPIHTTRLMLRPPIVGDGKTVNDAVIASYESLRLYTSWAQTLPSLEKSEEFVKMAADNWILKKNQSPYLPLFIFKLDTKEFIGATDFHNLHWDIPAFETGYWIHSQYQNQGYMTEAINGLTRYAFLQLNAKRFEIRCDITNTRSQRIPERLRFNLEATLKNNRLIPDSNKPSSTLIYARSNADNLPDLFVDWG